MCKKDSLGAPAVEQENASSSLVVRFLLFNLQLKNLV